MGPKSTFLRLISGHRSLRECSRFLCLMLSVFLLDPLSASSDDTLSFNQDIRPILSDACFHCHGPDANHREADLRLDDPQDAAGRAFVAGSLDESEAWARILSDDPELKMPPPKSGKNLSKQQTAKLREWILSGAQYEPYWAYAAPSRHAPPDVKRQDWPSDPLDHFILEPLESDGWSPAPDADPSTLLRRVSFDLTGLPPTLDQLDDFIGHPTFGNYQRHVDRLLASPAYGERMAIYWLDLTRFADTVGYHGDQDHSISPYRDYVIDSFNDNLPFDQFTREQLAGDLLPEPRIDQLIATGYNRLLQTSHEGGVQPKEYLAIYSADRIRNLSAVWMGATVGCAQCHDHKYDPFTIDDFYSLSAFFADIDEAQHFKNGTNSLPTRREPEIAVLSRWQRDWLEEVNAAIESLDESVDGQRLNELRAVKSSLEKSSRKTMITKSIAPREVRLLPRGNWLDESGPVMQPRVPKFLPAIEISDRRPTRLDLANWLVDRDSGVGGLTARVMVNRLWYLMFGRGISPSLEDFGGQGMPPTHPELLDQLASDFVDSGWDIKRMIRRLVLSRTYRQSSIATPDQLEKDPYNERLARQSRFRLPAEMVRDHALTAGGLLVRRVGGASVKPVQPAGYYRHLNFPQRVYWPDTDDNRLRRGVYVHWQRQFLHPMLKSMDAPSREECTAQRPRSNTPLEALVLLNDPAMMEAAKGLARRIRLNPDLPDDQRAWQLFRIATSRIPNEKESTTLLRLLAEQREYFRSNGDEASELVGKIENGVTKQDLVEQATWISMARMVMNLYETVSRN